MAEANPFAVAVGNLELIFFGLIHVVNPDYFYNPVHGIFKAFTFLTEDALLKPPYEGAGRIDDLSFYQISSYGTGCLAIAMTHLLLSHGDLPLKREVLKAKFWVTALSAFVGIRTVFGYDGDHLDGINTVFLALLSGMSVSNALWVLSDIVRHSKHPVLVEKTKATTLQIMTLWIDMILTASWGISLFFRDLTMLEPGSPFSVYSFTPNDDNTFTDLGRYLARLERVPLMVFTLCMLEIAIFDRSVEAIRANNKFALLCYLLYEINFIRQYFGCPYIDETSVAMHIVLNACFAAFIALCGPNVFTSPDASCLANLKTATAAPKASETTKDSPAATEPDLVAEAKKTK